MFAEGNPFVIGCNYWPRSSAMRMWKCFDATEIDGDFSTMESIGLKVVRIFLLWEDFQPEMDLVDPLMVERLCHVARMAMARKLKLDITFFTGHMSGPNWIPSWMLLRDLPMPSGVMSVISNGVRVDCGYKNPYTDEEVQLAEERLLRKVVEIVPRDAVAIWNLANEPDLVWNSNNPSECGRWISRMSDVIRSLDAEVISLS